MEAMVVSQKLRGAKMAGVGLSANCKQLKILVFKELIKVPILVGGIE